MTLSLEIQTAVFDRLNAFGALTALIDDVHDHVPQDAVFPYVQLGEDTSIPFDTHDSVGSEHTLTIHTWSRFRGKSETKKIQRQIFLALNRFALVVPGADTITSEFEFEESFLDDDGLTRHGVQRFRIIVDEG